MRLILLAVDVYVKQRMVFSRVRTLDRKPRERERSRVLYACVCMLQSGFYHLFTSRLRMDWTFAGR